MLSDLLVELVFAMFASADTEEQQETNAKKAQEIKAALNKLGMNEFDIQNAVSEVVCGNVQHSQAASGSYRAEDLQPSLQAMRWIVKQHQMLQYAYGPAIDVQSANLLLRVYDALSTPEKRQWFVEKLGDKKTTAGLITKCWGLVI